MMKKKRQIFNTFRYLCLSFVFVIGLIAIIGTGGCGGGSSGGGGGGGGDGSTSLATGEFTKTVTLASSFGWSAPFSTANHHQHQLYLASDIDGAGYIQSIELRLHDNTTGCSCPDATIKMGHTSLGGLTTTFAFNVEQGKGTLETVRTGAFTVPAGSAGDYFTIILDTPFLYNGVDNLVVEFLVTACDVAIDLRRDNSTLANGALWIGDLISATGAQWTTVLHTRFNFEGGDNPLFSNPTNQAIVPFNDNPNVQREQQLYLASDINGSGPITGLGIQVGGTTSEETYTVSVNLGHATVTTLASDYAANYSDSPVTVANAVSFTVPANVPSNSYVWIPLPDAVFTYNGTDNLILEFDVTAATGDTGFTMHAHGSGDVRWIYGLSDASVINSDTTNIGHIELRFNGGTIDKLTLANTSTGFPFNTGYSGRQYLYTASELGTKATITKVALRLESPSSTAEDYPNFTITMGHTSLTELTAVFGDNMDDASEVYNGTFSMPAGLIEGDWIEMTLDSPFIYNGTGNLVISFESDGSAIGHSVILGGSATLYPNRVLHLTGSFLQDLLAEIRFWTQ
jgi:hypothetical protein